MLCVLKVLVVTFCAYLSASDNIFREGDGAAAIQLVKTSQVDGKTHYDLNQDALELIKILSDNTAYEVVSIVGQARNGKSL